MREAGVERMKKLMLCLFVFLTSAIACFADTDVQVSVSLDQSTTLPGIPVGISLILKNSSNHSVTLRGFPYLRVTPEKGSSFFAKWGLNSEAGWITADATKPLQLRASETKEIRFPVDVTLTSPEWFFDNRLSFPGTYHLQIIIATSKDHIQDSITSNEVVLTVEDPHADDSLVWNRMQQLSGGKGWGGQEWTEMCFQLAKEIWDTHRTSNYFPYIAPMVPATVPEKIVIIEQALQMFPTSPMVDKLHGGVAGLYEQEMVDAFHKKDLVKARQMFDKNQEHLSLIVSNTKDPYVKEKAEKAQKSWQVEMHDHYDNWFKSSESSME
jgi:hypothetical protein